MNRSLTIVLVLVVIVLGAASTRLLLGHRTAGEVPADAKPPKDGTAQPVASSGAADPTAPEVAAMLPSSTSEPTADVIEPRPSRPARRATVPPAPLDGGAASRPQSVAHPPSVSSQPASEAPRDESAPEEPAALTAEIRRELIRRYFEALHQLRD